MQTSRIHWSGTTAALATALLVFAGCSSHPEMGQVQGTVRAGDQPLANVLVTFIPEGVVPGGTVRSMGQTDAQGRYRLRAENQRAGAVVGKHRVVVDDLAINEAPRSEDGTLLAKPPVRFPARYSDPLRSPLAREVAAGEQAIDLELNLSP